MTEVDYSPDAYNRYMATRARVGNWAAETSSYAAQYTHPFDGHQPRRRAAEFGPVPVVRPSDSISLYEPPSRRRERSRSRSHSRERERSRGMPRAPIVERPSRPRANTAPHGAPRPVLPAAHYAQPAPAAAPAGYKTIDLSRYPSHAFGPGGEIRLPPPRPGETYMIIPPKGKRVEVATGNGAHPYAVKMTSASASAPTSPTHHPHAYAQHVAPPPQRRPSHSSSSPARPVVPAAYAQPTNYFYTHPPAQPSPLHLTVPHGYTVQSPPDPSPTKKKQPPLLKRLLTSHVTWDARKPTTGRRLSD